MIIINNESLLRIPCLPVLPEEVGGLVQALENELTHANSLGVSGIGLAASQIGIGKNIAIIRMGEHSINLVNAKIVHAYDPVLFRDEGCLSFPGRVENTIRFQEVHVSHLFGEFIATGLLSVVCQHEIDHLNGALFLDHLAPKTTNKKIAGPNDPCPCGKLIDGKVRKFKKCCGKIL
jgi:peptide deformylase